MTDILKTFAIGFSGFVLSFAITPVDKLRVLVLLLTGAFIIRQWWVFEKKNRRK